MSQAKRGVNTRYNLWLDSHKNALPQPIIEENESCRLVTGIADPNLPFGGNMDDGNHLQKGGSTTMEAYLRDLGKFGETIQIEN